MRALAAACAWLLLASAPGPAHAGAPPGPGVSAEPASAAVGTFVRVRGSAWSPGTTVQAEVCGANAVHGSPDCDTPHAVTALVAPAGRFEAGLTVGEPPAHCPCVVRVSALPDSAGPPAAATSPLAIPGHPDGPVLRDVTPVRADIVSAELTGGGRRGELFGGAPRRTLVVRVRNAGAEPIVGAPLVARWGAGDVPDSPLEAPATGTIQPGRTATYRIQVRLPSASFGRFVVGGRFAGSVPFQAAFTTYPWGLLGANVVAALLLLIGVRISLRRRTARRRAAVQAAAGAAPPPRGRELDELIDHVRGLGRRSIDREELVAFLEERRGGPVDLAALDRYLGLDRFAVSEQER
ncbi:MULTISPECIES: hypothetical protein [Actinomadura]|uniref:IPT/TIG domain-containing protein n=1 Tax=Actinomadura yumaensis TaxID=111807 RepID=A0ABW2CDP7_9ACTN|nr:hypothetical protein [Actinomadura sp. J1-007]MWK38347.1 hypothetical protein [Actinomadura sp. J1-007]